MVTTDRKFGKSKKEGKVGAGYANFDQFNFRDKIFILQLMRSDEPVKRFYCRNFLLF